MPTWNDEHLAVVKEGGHVLKEWWVTHPHEPLNLDRADLSGAYLRDAMLSGANLSGTNLSHANLRDADLSHANLRGANLTGADLTGTNLTGADLTGADLVDAVLKWAVLKGTNLEDAEFFIAEFDQNRPRTPLVPSDVWLDRCRVHKARFRPRARDAWSVLRRTYTGPRFILSLLLLLAFVVPRIGKVMFWKGVEKAEMRMEETISELELQLDDYTVKHPESSALVRMIVTPLKEYGDFDETMRWKRHSIGGLVLGAHEPWWVMALAFGLLAFNLVRAVIMWFVAPIRDAEERSRVTPARDDYETWYWIHRCVATPLFVVSVGAVLWSMFDLLLTTVYLPA
ncbi:MAG: pentapeptide repeat-containing protein [Planctomycetota bacterium]